MSSFYSAATAVIENSDGEILMVQEGKDHVHGKWDFPGGGWEDSESITECIRREVKEETGYLVEPESLIGIWKGENLKDGTEVIVFVFKAGIIDKEEAESGEEIIDYGFFDPDEIRNLDLRREDKIQILDRYEKGGEYSMDIFFNDLDLLES